MIEKFKLKKNYNHDWATQELNQLSKDLLMDGGPTSFDTWTFVCSAPWPINLLYV